MAQKNYLGGCTTVPNFALRYHTNTHKQTTLTTAQRAAAQATRRRRNDGDGDDGDEGDDDDARQSFSSTPHDVLSLDLAKAAAMGFR